MLKAVVLDWAGTTIDYGCIAPAAVFIEVFRQQGVEITIAEARAPMGMFKRDHIAAITQMPAVIERWKSAHGRAPTDDDVEAMYRAFSPLQMETLASHAALIPGAREAIEAFRGRGLKVGSCTGYTRAMMDRLVPLAREQGYEPDALVCGDEVPQGRPAPWMALQNAMQFNAYPMYTVVKIGDTPVDIAEGLNAGMWTIGVALTGNEVGLSEAEIKLLAPQELAARRLIAYERLTAAGAHYVVDTLLDAVACLDDVEARLSAGDRPS
jgi:phosphonoacetaldehyde hydrolase